MSPSNRLVSLLFRFSAKQSDQCRGPVRGFLLSLIPVTLRTDIPKRSKTVSTLKVRDRAGGGNGGEGGELALLPHSLCEIKDCIFQRHY